MKVIVGSKNPVKIEAVRQAFAEYFPDVQVDGSDASSGVKAQPDSLREMSFGAMNRAMNAFRAGYAYSIGLEAGIFEVPNSLSGYMDANFTAIWNGMQFVGFGMSPSFEYPKHFVHSILKEKKEVGDLMNALLSRTDVKHKEGAVGHFSKSKMQRVDFIKSSVVMALIPMLNKDVYK